MSSEATSSETFSHRLVPNKDHTAKSWTKTSFKKLQTVCWSTTIRTAKKNSSSYCSITRLSTYCGSGECLHYPTVMHSLSASVDLDRPHWPNLQASWQTTTTSRSTSIESRRLRTSVRSSMRSSSRLAARLSPQPLCSLRRVFCLKTS